MNFRQTKAVELTTLVIILCFAFYIAFIPHLNYAYPLHVDEWYNGGRSQAILDAESISYPDPFLDEKVTQDQPEIGFHLLLSELKLFTGLSWPEIFRFFPSIIFMLGVLAVYILGRRSGFGLEAAFFVSLIPTTVRISGPAFLTPVSLGILFVPLILFILNYFDVDISMAALLLVLLSFLFLMHPPTGLALSLVCGTYALFFLGRRSSNRRWQQSALIFMAILLASSVIILRYSLFAVEDIMAVVEASAYPFSPVRDVLQKFGYLPLALFSIGCGFLWYKGTAKNYALISSAGLFLIVIILFAWFGLGIPILYERSWLYFLTLAGIISGFGLKELRAKAAGYLSRHIKQTGIISVVISLFFMTPSAWLSLQNHYQEPYYHIIDDETYADFLWIRQNLNAHYQRAVLDPWLAITFPSLAGKQVYSYSAIYPVLEERAETIVETQKFLRDGCRDTTWLRDKGISIVYTKEIVNNHDLKMVHQHTYILPP